MLVTHQHHKHRPPAGLLIQVDERYTATITATTVNRQYTFTRHVRVHGSESTHHEARIIRQPVYRPPRADVRVNHAGDDRI
jgi:hypothetical protein